MPLLRSRRSLPETPLKALVSSSEPFTLPITDSSPNTTDSSVTNSQRRFSLRLANKLSSSLVIAEADESADKGKRGSVTCSSSDFGEEMRTQSGCGSGISRRRLRTGSGHAEKDSEIVASFKGGGSGYGVEETGKKMRAEHELKDPLIPFPSPEPFTPSITDSSPDTSMTATQAACITNSRGRRVTQRLASDIRLPVIVAINEAAHSSKGSSRVSRRSLGTGSYDVNKKVKMAMTGDGAEEKLEIKSGKDEQGSNSMESSPKHETTSAEVLVRDSDWHMAEDDKKGEVHGSAQEEGGCISLRSGSRVPKRKIVDDGVDFLLVNKPHDGLVAVEDQLGKGTNSVFMGGNMVDNEVVGKLFLDGDELLESGLEILASQDESLGNLVLQDHMVSASEVDINAVPIPEGLHEETLIVDGLTHKKRPKRYIGEEKGKEKLSFQATEGEQVTKEEEFGEGVGSREQESRGSIEKAKDRREAARKLAVELAHEFAFFKAEEEEEEETEEVEVDDSMPNAKEDGQEWFGPFSTALKLIEERELILRARSLNFSSQSERAEVKIPWKPSIHKPASFGIPAPSLKDLCLKVLCDNVEEVESLEGLPDVIRHNISFLLCHLRRMSFHALCLLTEGFPIEIYLSDCSWATQKQFEEVFSRCNLDSLKVLQLDFCGRCLPDYVLHSTFAKAPNCLPSLNRLSLKGAYCLSDSGLDAIISSASLLKSLNLSQCSLITSKGIISLAEKLGPVLQELYIDACHNVDAMLILPALKKLKSLEVLSIAHMETVTDKFFKKLIPVSGPKMRGLMVAGCRKLTNASMKIIGENCPHLFCLDIRLLNRLNDSTIEHLANGGCPFQTLKICHGAFSDEALAALLETSGATLLELVLNNIEKAAGNTALAISRRCSPSLRSLDLSFCREMTDEALGLIVDSCSNLRILKLFGCTQVTNVFLEGHSNSIVKIIGLKGSILDEIEVPVFN